MKNILFLIITQVAATINGRYFYLILFIFDSSFEVY